MAFVNEINLSATANNVSLNIDTTGLGANGVIVVFLTAGRGPGAGNMTGAAFTTPTLGGSSTGWVEKINETINASTLTGMVGAWYLLNPTSSASISLALAYTGGSGGTSDHISGVVGLYSSVASIGVTAFTDNDGVSGTTDTMTNAPAAGNTMVGAWAHGSNISSVTSGTLRGSINNANVDYGNGCHCFIEGTTIAFSSGSSDSQIGMQLELVAAAATDSSPAPSGPGVTIGGFLGPLGFQWLQQTGIEATGFPPFEFVAQIASLQLAADQGAVTADAVTVTAQVATLTLSAVANVPTAGAVTVTAQVATLTLSAVNGSLAVSLTAQVATLSLTAIQGTTTVGAVTVTAQVATLTLNGVAGVKTAGAVTITAQVATLTLTALQGTVTAGTATKTAQVATLTLNALQGTTTVGAVTVTAQVATLNLTAIQGVVSGGSGALTAQIATLTLSALQGTVTVGAVTVTAQVATLSLSAIQGTISSGVVKTAQIATLSLTAVAGSLTAGSVTITAQVATLTLNGRQGTITSGAATTTAQVAVLTLTGVHGVIFAGTVVIVVGTIIYGQDPNVIRGRNAATSSSPDPGVIRGRDPAPIYGQDTRTLQGA